MTNGDSHAFSVCMEEFDMSLLKPNTIIKYSLIYNNSNVKKIVCQHIYEQPETETISELYFSTSIFMFKA